jgi:hypothetical protein
MQVTAPGQLDRKAGSSSRATKQAPLGKKHKSILSRVLSTVNATRIAVRSV